MRIEFNPGVNLDTAAADIREAVAQVERRLPDRVEDVVVTKADDDADPIIDLAIVSDNYSEDALTRIIDTDIAPEILSIEGVAAVQEFGTRLTQMRVVIDPPRLSRFGLTVSDVAAALRQAPFDVPVGSFRSDDQELIVRAEATAADPERIKEVVITEAVRVGDVAEVTLAPADAANLLRLDGRPIIGLGIVRQAQSNTIDISDTVAEKVAQLNRRFDDIEIRVLSDQAVFIRISVREVLTSLLFTILIVISTIWMFLQSARATIVPSVAIPVALIGTVAGIWLMGFSINILTLLALVLATGLIVDDAIVVLENVQRKQSGGLQPHAAAAVGTRQVFFAVISTTAVLVAVFVPISFLPSTAGRLFREFGFVLALAVIISSFVALTLAPAISAQFRFSNGRRGETPLTKIGTRLNNAYAAILQRCLLRPWITLGVAVLSAAAAVLIFRLLPSELVPPEDRGEIFIFATGPDGVGLSYMERQADAMEDILRPYRENGEIASLYTVVGRYDPNRVLINAKLAPWEDRNRSQQDLIAELRGPLSDIPGVRASVFGRGSLDIGRGRRSGLEVALTGGDYDGIYRGARALSDAIETQSDILENPEISYQPTQPQLSIAVDRRRAADLDVPLDEIALTLRAMVDGEDLVDLNVGDEAIPIILEAETTAITQPSDLRNLYVRSGSGALVPLSSLTTLNEEGVAAELDRVEQRRAIELEADVVGDTPLAEAVTEIERLADAVLPDGVDMLLQGEAETLGDSSRDVLITYLFAIVIVFLVLVAQFESLSSPFVIMLIVPFGLASAIYALFLSGTSLNIYSQIGLILLVGLMAKNGILMVEFADQLRGEGKSLRDAAFNAATIRARPIAMTVISTALGALPLVLSSGAGSEARAAIGWIVFGGLGFAALYTLFLTPVLYLGVARLGKARTAGANALDAELEAADNQTAERPATS